MPEGDIAAIGKLDPVAAGDLLSKREPQKIQINFKALPVISSRDRDQGSGKMMFGSPALCRNWLKRTPASMRRSTTHEILLQGQGEPHLRSVLDIA